MRESIVAVSKLLKENLVILIYACCILSHVEANDNNETDSNCKDKSTLDKIGTIVSIVVGNFTILGVIVAVFTFYYQNIKQKKENTEEQLKEKKVLVYDGEGRIKLLIHENEIASIGEDEQEIENVFGEV